MLYLKFIFLLSALVFSFESNSRDLSSIHPVKEKINNLYKKGSQLDSVQLYALEINLAESLLKEIQSMRGEDFQKSIEQVKEISVQALQLYKKTYSRLSDKYEKSKILFRIGYIHEIINSNRDALNTYNKIISMKLPNKITQEARSLRNRVQKKIKNSKKVSPPVPKNNELRVVLSQTEQDIKNQNWVQALDGFEKSCQKYLENPSSSHKNSPQVIKNLFHLAHQGRDPESITKMYQIYLSYFPLDFVMVLSASDWATYVKDFDRALGFYQRYILVQKHKIQSSHKDKKNNQWVDLESVFHLYHSIAQQSSNPNLKIQAYDFYLTHSALKKSAIEVEYLKNKVLFQLEEFDIVAPIFREIVFSSRSSQSLKEEAAMLALQSVLKIERVVVARKWAHEFSKILPNKKDEFQKLLPS